jgi:hypothetical protein
MYSVTLKYSVEIKVLAFVICLQEKYFVTVEIHVCSRLDIPFLSAAHGKNERSGLF